MAGLDSRIAISVASVPHGATFRVDVPLGA
jgi:hypothetical protein